MPKCLSHSTIRNAAALLLVILAFACGGSGAATTAAPPAIEAQRSAIVQFQQSLEALERTPDASARNLRQVVMTAGAVLTQHGIKWYRAPDDPDTIVIAPVRGISQLNNLAHGLMRDVGGLALRFDPRALQEEDAAALYDEDAHQLLMSASEVENGTVSDYLAHEIVHARNFHALSRGIDNIFMGWISSHKSTSPFHPTYPHLFSIDELQAYAQQARVNIRDLRRGHGDVEGTVEMLDAGRQLALATTDAATLAIGLIASLNAANAAKPDFSEMRTVRDEPTLVTGFAAALGRVYFHQERLPSRLARPPPVMRAVAELAGLQMALLIPREFVPDSAHEAVDVFLTRATILADRSKALSASFLELRHSVVAGAFAAAFERSHLLRVLSKRS